MNLDETLIPLFEVGFKLDWEMWADFHIHSNFSDGSMSIAQIVDFFGRRGFGAIAITDHLCQTEGLIGRAAKYLGQTLTKETFGDYQKSLKEQAHRAMEQYQMVLLPGIELTKNSFLNHRAAHIVGIGLQDFISADLSIETIAQSIREAGGLSIAAHPLNPGRIKDEPYHLWDRRNELRGLFDAWEITYGSILLKEVAKSDLPKIASSDLHRPAQMRSWKTWLNCERHPEAIMRAIRNQKIDFRYYEDRAPAPLGGLSPSYEWAGALTFNY